MCLDAAADLKITMDTIVPISVIISFQWHAPLPLCLWQYHFISMSLYHSAYPARYKRHSPIAGRAQPVAGSARRRSHETPSPWSLYLYIKAVVALTTRHWNEHKGCEVMCARLRYWWLSVKFVGWDLNFVGGFHVLIENGKFKMA